MTVTEEQKIKLQALHNEAVKANYMWRTAIHGTPHKRRLEAEYYKAEGEFTSYLLSLSLKK